MPLDAGFVQLNSITEYQKWLHQSRNTSRRVKQKEFETGPDGETREVETEVEVSEPDPLESVFHGERIRVGWHTTFRENLELETSDTSIKAKSNRSAHFLLNTTLVFRTPEIISTTPNIKVAWSPNLLHNYATFSELKFNDIVVQSYDSVGLDILAQFMPVKMGPEKREQYFRNIGNRPYLLEFSDRLQATRLSLPMPWSFASRDDKAIPLCLATSTLVTMKINLQRDPTKLVRIMEEKSTGPVLRALKPDDLGTRVQIITSGNRHNLLGTPEIKGKYALTSKAELNWLKSQPSVEMYYDTLTSLDAEDDTQTSLQLHSTAPVRALFFVAQNLTASAINNYSNYTTNAVDPYAGYSPISQVSLHYQNYKAIEKEDSEVFSEDEPYWSTPACPQQPGYHAIVFPTNLDRDEDVGIVLTGIGAKLITKYDSQRYSALNSKISSSYILRARALTSQVFIYENNGISIPNKVT